MFDFNERFWLTIQDIEYRTGDLYKLHGEDRLELYYDLKNTLELMLELEEVKEDNYYRYSEDIQSSLDYLEEVFGGY